MSNSPPSSEFYRPRIGQAADKGLLITCRCYACRQSRVYLASDLATIYHPLAFIEDLFGGRCPKCGSTGSWKIRQRYPSTSDVGMLQVRRPAGVRTTQLWRDELYSAPPRLDSEPQAGSQS